MDLQISTRVAVAMLYFASSRPYIAEKSSYFLICWALCIKVAQKNDTAFRPKTFRLPQLTPDKTCFRVCLSCLVRCVLVGNKVIPYMYGSHELFPTQPEPQGFKQALPAYVLFGLSGERCVNISYTYTAGIRAVLSNSIVEEKSHCGRFNRVLVLQMGSSDRY
ncbi:hypothetical protein P167DRAFT_219465 [Morchella conica CCBAS932]|uniref:Uncharacterized protein n=1 Tax=Morchella conica CCBAS932 TaxID=1392247 RepID=A0A3N4KL58_9PEZI|nr:hypothetical protein P167DRAFT_219465 [Morchella conica CCBAS932]